MDNHNIQEVYHDLTTGNGHDENGDEPQLSALSAKSYTTESNGD